MLDGREYKKLKIESWDWTGYNRDKAYYSLLDTDGGKKGNCNYNI